MGGGARGDPIGLQALRRHWEDFDWQGRTLGLRIGRGLMGGTTSFCEPVNLGRGENSEKAPLRS